MSFNVFGGSQAAIFYTKYIPVPRLDFLWLGVGYPTNLFAESISLSRTGYLITTGNCLVNKNTPTAFECFCLIRILEWKKNHLQASPQNDRSHDPQHSRSATRRDALTSFATVISYLSLRSNGPTVQWTGGVGGLVVSVEGILQG